MKMIGKFLAAMLFCSPVFASDTIKFFIPNAASEYHRYSLLLKSAAEKNDKKIIIKAAPGKENLGVLREFINERGPAVAFVSMSTVASHVVNNKFKKEDFLDGFILSEARLAITCTAECGGIKIFNDLIDNTNRTFRVATTSVISNLIAKQVKDSGVKMIVVPYSSWPEIAPDMLSNTIDFSVNININRGDKFKIIEVPLEFADTRTHNGIFFKNISENEVREWLKDPAVIKNLPYPDTIKNINFKTTFNSYQERFKR